MHFAEDGNAAGYRVCVIMAHGEQDRIRIALR